MAQMNQIFTNLFKTLDLPGSAENEYVMKGTIRKCWLSYPLASFTYLKFKWKKNITDIN